MITKSISTAKMPTEAQPIFQVSFALQGDRGQIGSASAPLQLQALAPIS